MALLLQTLPGSRDLLMAIVTLGACWRFLYVFVVPVIFGIAIVALLRYSQKQGWFRGGIAVCYMGGLKHRLLI